MDVKPNRSLIIERVFYFANRIISVKTAISRKKQAKFLLETGTLILGIAKLLPKTAIIRS